MCNKNYNQVTKVVVVHLLRYTGAIIWEFITSRPGLHWQISTFVIDWPITHISACIYPVYTFYILKDFDETESSEQVSQVKAKPREVSPVLTEACVREVLMEVAEDPILKLSD